MKKLKQTGTLQEYLLAFNSLLDKAQLSKEQAVNCFLVGLQHEMEKMVRMFSPKALQTAYSLAKLQEAFKSEPSIRRSFSKKPSPISHKQVMVLAQQSRMQP